MSITGTVKHWVAGKGFGFIYPSDGSADMFVHFRQVQGGRTSLNVGEKVTYTIGQNPRTGRPVAENVVGDGTGSPALEVGQGANGSRGGFGGIGGSTGLGRATHGRGTPIGSAGYGRGFHSGYGGRGMGASRVTEAPYGGRGMAGNACGAPQSRFSPYGAQGSVGYGRGYGGYVQEQQGAGMYAQHGSGINVQQGVCAEQEVGVVGYGNQQGASGFRYQEGLMNSTYQQQGAEGIPPPQAVPADNKFTEQASISHGHAHKSSAPVIDNSGLQQASTTQTQQVNVGSYNVGSGQIQSADCLPVQAGYTENAQI